MGPNNPNPNNPTAPGLSPVKRKIIRSGSMRNERATWIPRYREMSEFLLPFSGRFFLQDRNRGNKSFNSIYDSTGTRAARILAAGLMAGVTSPARPWFRLSTGGDDLDDSSNVRLWLAAVSRLMLDIFAKSNTYRMLHTVYEELGVFGTAPAIIDDNYDTVLWGTPLTAGEYSIAVNHLGKVDTLAREFEMTVSQLVGKFGVENVSPTVKSMYDTGKSMDVWIPILHMIEPREMSERDMRSPKAIDMAYSSCYIEIGQHNDKYLRESGYPEFPVLCPRWNVRGSDIYGHSPGMEVLPDVKQLQHEQFRKAQGIDYQTRPPLQMPTILKGQEKNSLPGGVTYNDDMSRPIKTMFDVNLDLEHLGRDILDVRTRINQGMYADLFLMIADSADTTRQPATATEIAEKKEEKLLMIGPVLERLHDELLNPLIDITFAKIVKAGLLSGALAPPKEMQGRELNVQFISVLAQAQRAVGLGAMDRLLGTVQSMAGMVPSVLDKINTDEVVDRYSDMLGVDQRVIVADDKVAFIRASRQKAMEAQQKLAAANSAADTAQKLGTVQTQQPNAAAQVIQKLSGIPGGGDPGTAVNQSY